MAESGFSFINRSHDIVPGEDSIFVLHRRKASMFLTEGEVRGVSPLGRGLSLRVFLS
jgi:hypothetical protein